MENKKEVYLLMIEKENTELVKKELMKDGFLEIYDKYDIKKMSYSLHDSIVKKLKNTLNIQEFYKNIIKISNINPDDFKNKYYRDMLCKILESSHMKNREINEFLKENNIEKKIIFDIDEKNIICHNEISGEEIKALFENRDYYNVSILDEKGECIETYGPHYVVDSIFNIDVINEVFELKFNEDYNYILDTKEKKYDFNNVPKMKIFFKEV